MNLPKTFIRTPEGKEKPVKNLGWLVKAFRERVLMSIQFQYPVFKGELNTLRVYFEGGFYFQTEFSDAAIFGRWIRNRRSLKGCNKVCSFVHPNGTVHKEITL